jgi:hypothetical protein
MNKLIDAVKTFLAGVEYIEKEENANYVVTKEDKELLQEAIDTVVAEIERPLPTDEKTVCPECLKKCTNEELRMFGGLCEECSTDFN